LTRDTALPSRRTPASSVEQLATNAASGRCGSWWHENNAKENAISCHLDFARLRIYLDTRLTNPSLKFMTWLRVVSKRVGIDYLRGHPDYIDRRRQADRGSAPGEWVEAGTLPSGSKLHGERPPVTNRGTAQQLLRYAAGAIPDVQRRALELWVQSETYDEIARVLGLEDGLAAERMVRAAIERLRRKSASKATSDERSQTTA